jgi:hypothetical protein
MIHLNAQNTIRLDFTRILGEHNPVSARRTEERGRMPKDRSMTRPKPVV